MKRICLLSLIALIPIIFSCKKDKEDNPAPSKEIFPLKSGYTWNFLTTTFDSLQSVHVNKVLKDTTLYGETWYILTYDDTIRTLCKNKSDGWWFIMTNAQHPAGEPVMYYRYPANVQDQYMTADSSLVTVVSTSASVTVPAGTFSCYQYHMVHYKDGYECEEYFCPGTGFIKHIIWGGKKSGKSIVEVTELTSCTL